MRSNPAVKTSWKQQTIKPVDAPAPHFLAEASRFDRDRHRSGSKGAFSTCHRSHSLVAMMGLHRLRRGVYVCPSVWMYTCFLGMHFRLLHSLGFEPRPPSVRKGWVHDTRSAWLLLGSPESLALPCCKWFAEAAWLKSLYLTLYTLRLAIFASPCCLSARSSFKVREVTAACSFSKVRKQRGSQ